MLKPQVKGARLLKYTNSFKKKKKKIQHHLGLGGLGLGWLLADLSSAVRSRGQAALRGAQLAPALALWEACGCV